jgi:LysR family transcriptional activator of nhaA
MNYNHLFYFWNIAKEGSIKNASQLLHLSQPTLSDQLKTFEKSIGEKLFDRSGRKLVLNEKGRSVFVYANRMFKIGNELSDSLTKKNLNQKRVVNIGFVPTIAKGVVYEILSAFLVHKDMVMNAIEAEFELILKAFETEDLDMIICGRPILDADDRCRLFKISGCKFCVVCSPSFKYEKNQFPRCLSKLPFMNYTDHSDVHRQILDYFYNNSIYPQIIGEVDDVNIIRRFTINGHCFSILPMSVIEETLKAGKLVILSELPEIKVSIYAIVRNKPRNEPIFSVLETLLEKGGLFLEKSMKSEKIETCSFEC